MELLKQTDLMNIIDYEKVREKYRKDIIDYNCLLYTSDAADE